MCKTTGLKAQQLCKKKKLKGINVTKWVYIDEIISKYNKKQQYKIVFQICTYKVCRLLGLRSEKLAI